MPRKSKVQKMQGIIDKAIDNGNLPKGFSLHDFHEMLNCFYLIKNNGYAETINTVVAVLFNKNGYTIFDRENMVNPENEIDENKIGFRICE